MEGEEIKRKKNLIIDDDNDIYTAEGTEDLVEDDEISAEEEGFMRGYREADENY